MRFSDACARRARQRAGNWAVGRSSPLAAESGRPSCIYQGVGRRQGLFEGQTRASKRRPAARGCSIGTVRNTKGCAGCKRRAVRVRPAAPSEKRQGPRAGPRGSAGSVQGAAPPGRRARGAQASFCPSTWGRVDRTTAAASSMTAASTPSSLRVATKWPATASKWASVSDRCLWASYMLRPL